MTAPVPAGIVEAAAKALVMEQTNGLCDEWPRACADCDCFRDQSPTLSAARDRSQARAVLAVVLPMVADEIEAERVCGECIDFYSGKPTPKHDLELGCADDCPCKHAHTHWAGYTDGALTKAARIVRSLAEGLGDG